MNNELTVGELIEYLKLLPDTWPVYWYGNAAVDSNYFYLSMPKLQPIIGESAARSFIEGNKGYK